MMFGGCDIDLSGDGYHAISDDGDRKRRYTLKPGGEAFGETGGDVLHEREWHGIAAAERGEELSERAGSAGGGDDPHHPVGAWAYGRAGFAPTGVWGRGAYGNAPSHEFHLAHD